MNWGKDSQLFLQISKKKKTAQFAAHRVRENCLMLHLFWIFLVAMFSFPSLVESRTVAMPGLIYFDCALIQLAALRAPIKSDRTFFYMPAAWGRERDGSVTKTSWDRSVWERKGSPGHSSSHVLKVHLRFPPSLQFNAQLKCYKWKDKSKSHNLGEALK